MGSNRPDNDARGAFDVDVDAERPAFEDVEVGDLDGDDDITMPLGAPIEAPIDDLIDQRRAEPIDDDHEQ
jgi:hypothetical protein